MKPVLLYIDEEPIALRTYRRRLQLCVGSEVDVVTLPPAANIDAMMGEIGKIAQLASIVIDQRLMAAGTADYLGTQLAERLRLQDKQIPLYILTNHAEDIDTFTGTVEYVLSKGDLATTEKIAAIGARIKRHMDIYSHIQGDREERFELLLRKRFDTSLNSDEEDEFQRLKFSRDREDLTVETPAKDRLLAKLDDAELQLKKIEESLKFRP